MKKFLIVIVCWWMSISAIMSCMASRDPDFFNENHNHFRVPFLIVQVLDVHLGEDGRGYDQFGYYVWAERDSKVFLVFNPFTNYCDDIIARFDF